MEKNRREFFKITGVIGVACIATSAASSIFAKDSKDFIESNNHKKDSKNIESNIIKENTMKLTQNAKQNFTTLFKNTNAPLAKSDPEFFINYVNFAFDDVYAKSAILTQEERVLITLASLIASNSLSEFSYFVQGTLNIKINPERIKELIHQATPYIGLPRTLDFITQCNEIFIQNGIKLPLKSQSNTTRQNRFEKGLSVQREIFGEIIDKGNAAAPLDVKHIREFLSSNCFGDYYTRSGLDLQFRELLTFVYLLSFGGADSQVKAHIQGNLNMGNDREKLIAVITALIPYVGYPRALNALGALDSLTLATK